MTDKPDDLAVPPHYFRDQPKREPKPKTFTFRRYEKLADPKPQAKRIESKTVMAGDSLPAEDVNREITHAFGRCCACQREFIADPGVFADGWTCDDCKATYAAGWQAVTDMFASPEQQAAYNASLVSEYGTTEQFAFLVSATCSLCGKPCCHWSNATEEPTCGDCIA